MCSLDISNTSHHSGNEPLSLLGDGHLALAAAGGGGHPRHLVHILLLLPDLCVLLGDVGAALRPLVIHRRRHAADDNLLSNNQMVGPHVTIMDDRKTNCAKLIAIWVFLD